MAEKTHLSPTALFQLLHDGPFHVGEARALRTLQINRTTLGRWLSGQVKVPHSAALVLRQLAEGIPPGGSTHWTGFQWDGNDLITPAGERVAARRIEQLVWQDQHVAALKRRVAELENVVEQLRRLDSANDAVMDAVYRPTGPLSTPAEKAPSPRWPRRGWRRQRR
jgi:hypothetical protein